MNRKIIVGMVLACFVMSPAMIGSAASFRDIGEVAQKIQCGDPDMQLEMNRAYLEDQLKKLEKEKNADNYYRYGRLAYALSQYDVAANLFSEYEWFEGENKAMDGAGKKSADIANVEEERILFALSLAKSDNVDKAEKVAETIPDSWQKNYVLGNIEEQKKNLDKATKYYLLACKDENGVLVARRSLIRLKRNGLSGNLLKESQKYINLSPEGKDKFLKEKISACKAAKEWYVQKNNIQLPDDVTLY